MVLLDSQESAATEREIVDRALPSLDGLVIASARSSDTALRGYAKKVPTVVLNRVVGGLPCAIPDNARGTRRAVEHLAELGHQKVCYVAGPDASWANGAGGGPSGRRASSWA